MYSTGWGEGTGRGEDKTLNCRCAFTIDNWKSICCRTIYVSLHKVPWPHSGCGSWLSIHFEMALAAPPLLRHTCLLTAREARDCKWKRKLKVTTDGELLCPAHTPRCSFSILSVTSLGQSENFVLLMLQMIYCSAVGRERGGGLIKMHRKLFGQFRRAQMTWHIQGGFGSGSGTGTGTGSVVVVDECINAQYLIWVICVCLLSILYPLVLYIAFRIIFWIYK